MCVYFKNKHVFMSILCNKKRQNGIMLFIKILKQHDEQNYCGI